MFYSVQVVNSAAKTYYMSAGAVSTVQKMVDKVEPSQDKLLQNKIPQETKVNKTFLLVSLLFCS